MRNVKEIIPLNQKEMNEQIIAVGKRIDNSISGIHELILCLIEKTTRDQPQRQVDFNMRAFLNKKGIFGSFSEEYEKHEGLAKWNIEYKNILITIRRRINNPSYDKSIVTVYLDIDYGQTKLKVFEFDWGVDKITQFEYNGVLDLYYEPYRERLFEYFIEILNEIVDIYISIGASDDLLDIECLFKNEQIPKHNLVKTIDGIIIDFTKNLDKKVNDTIADFKNDVSKTISHLMDLNKELSKDESFNDVFYKKCVKLMSLHMYAYVQMTIREIRKSHIEFLNEYEKLEPHFNK